ncbi:hypothetical protein OBBRIDRAFT_864110 [Obba rivulosa]|uniref:RING-type domain-containing protein n=1 Tax=Obba rivulosa TaxID=1052685 RepID=A0A8E2AHY9_9APHY|nr:hypothetical protein OBBRIDRAFT_864110 [Obba rivulosa]
MPTCVICLDTLKDPAALSCGHVFCYECITRVAAAVTPYSAQHFCPTCKHPYMTTQLDPAFIPTYLRQHVTPSVRKLHLDYTVPTMSTKSPPNDIETLRAENASLRTCCFVWRRRAAVHASATLGLVGLARITRDHALKLKAEKDVLQSRYDALKRKYDESQYAGTLRYNEKLLNFPQALGFLPTFADLTACGGAPNRSPLRGMSESGF